MLSLVITLLTAPVLADGIYTWEDENGQRHYSDMPRDGAEEVEVQPAQTFSSSAVSRPRASSADDEADAGASGYESLEITSPDMEETLWNTGGTISVNWTLKPKLQQGHSMRLYMDGQLQANLPVAATSVNMSGVERGAHNIKVEVQDQNGNTKIQSQTVTFFVQQRAIGRAANQPRANQPTGPRPRPRLGP